jgi:hypothetical protein
VFLLEFKTIVFFPLGQFLSLLALLKDCTNGVVGGVGVDDKEFP